MISGCEAVADETLAQFARQLEQQRIL